MTGKVKVMIQTLLQSAKQQRIAWSCAILVCLFLTVFGRAPVLPVLAGCVLAIGVAVVRSKPAVALRRSK